MIEKYQGHEIYILATKEDQAKIIYEMAEGYIKDLLKRFPKELNEVVKIYKGKKHGLINQKKNSFVKYLSGNVTDGDNASVFFVDEYHEHVSDVNFKAMESGTLSRENPIIFICTTAGFNRVSPCGIMHLNAVKMLTGSLKINGFLPFIFSMDKEEKEGDGWKNGKNWIKANPNLGVTVIKDALVSKFQKAEKLLGKDLTTFRTKHLNIWEQSYNAWLTSSQWKSLGCISEEQEEKLKGAVCFGGLDIGTISDFTAFSLFFPDGLGENKHVEITYLITTEKNIINGASYVDYMDWHKKGYIISCGIESLDHQQCADFILSKIEPYDFFCMGYDPFAAGHGIQARLEQNEISLMSVRQTTYGLNTPMTTVEEYCVGKQMFHKKNPVMDWMVSNCEVFKDTSGNQKPDKSKRNRKIDGVSSLLNAVFCSQKITVV